MRTTMEIIDAVREGTPVTDEEMKFCIVLLSQMTGQDHTAMACAIVDSDKKWTISNTTKIKLKSAFDAYGNLHKDLDKLIRGSSFEPGIGKKESRKRMVDATVKTGAALYEVLTTLSEKK